MGVCMFVCVRKCVHVFYNNIAVHKVQNFLAALLRLANRRWFPDTFNERQDLLDAHSICCENGAYFYHAYLFVLYMTRILLIHFKL